MRASHVVTIISGIVHTLVVLPIVWLGTEGSVFAIVMAEFFIVLVHVWLWRWFL